MRKRGSLRYFLGLTAGGDLGVVGETGVGLGVERGEGVLGVTGRDKVALGGIGGVIG